ncbi:MAG: C-terminal target protein [Bacteroidetes bacterium]|jgi:hypothetical protein|nr:C-terminal target protein [Bacteroidota bacterium]
MKKLYFSLLSIVLGLGMNAQLTQANHAPANGNTFSTWQCDSAGVTPGASGAGATWNYATIATHSSVVSDFTAQTVSNASYPNADIAVFSSTSNISYYKSSVTELKYWGGNLSIGGIAATIQYTAPAISAAYPMSMGTTSASVTGGSLVALSNPGTFTGNSEVTADASGTLILPSGTYTNILRVVTSQTINFTASFVTGTVTQMNFDYYEIGTKAPLFSIATATAGTSISAASSQTVVTRFKPVTVGVSENSISEINMNVYPNPSNSVINFTTESKNATAVSIYDVTGKLVETAEMNNGELHLNVSTYSAGIYTYKVTGSEKQTLKAGKITVTH